MSEAAPPAQVEDCPNCDGRGGICVQVCCGNPMFFDVCCEKPEEDVEACSRCGGRGVIARRPAIAQIQGASA